MSASTEKTELVVRPKVLLDAEMLAAINKHYASRLKDEVVGRECFSDPKLDSHVCNIYKEPAGGACEHCGNRPGRFCQVTCHIYAFCLAAYAFRLGIGAPKSRRAKPLPAIRHNLKKVTFKKLYALVMELHSEDSEGRLDVVKSAPEVHDDLQMDLVLDALRKSGKGVEESGVEWVSLRKAANAIDGLSYSKLYGHVKRGDIAASKLGKDANTRAPLHVRLSDLKALVRKQKVVTDGQ